MNKKKVNELIPKAYDVLNDVKIANEGKILNGYRGQISTFGAAITMGSLNSAVAFFSKKVGDSDKENSSGVDRLSILKGIIKLLEIEHTENEDCGEVLVRYIKNITEKVAKENIINAAIALKLSMNLYELVKDKDGNFLGEENGKS